MVDKYVGSSDRAPDRSADRGYDGLNPSDRDRSDSCIFILPKIQVKPVTDRGESFSLTVDNTCSEDLMSAS
ncbi:hypothetical protein [Chamaesiphon sp.]|uniref:hypothetical protein n=1 Tax=Chamaesiphon sp. TaxID=2814140 RepID=UPI003593CD07